MSSSDHVSRPVQDSLLRRISRPLFGPEATNGELALGWGAALIGAALQLIWALTRGDWTWWQTLIAALFALDICGGVVVNATRSAARYWHRPGRTWADHNRFLVVHVYPFIVAWLWPDYAWSQALALYLSMLIMANTVLAAPVHLRRPLAFGLAALGITASMSLLRMPAGLVWLPPLYYIKLVMAYAGDDGAA
ncbi:MAG: hypothetical protein GXP42_13515 [Chloroflexi bacterium]|nr:hypothetical protein [Chloroflexota bacterium]